MDLVPNRHRQVADAAKCRSTAIVQTKRRRLGVRAVDVPTYRRVMNLWVDIPTEVYVRIFDGVTWIPDVCTLCGASKEMVANIRRYYSTRPCITVAVPPSDLPLGLPLLYPLQASAICILCPVLRDGDCDPFMVWYEFFHSTRRSEVKTLQTVAPTMGIRVFSSLLNALLETSYHMSLDRVEVRIERGLLKQGRFGYVEVNQMYVLLKVHALLHYVRDVTVQVGIHRVTVEEVNVAFALHA